MLYICPHLLWFLGNVYNSLQYLQLVESFENSLRASRLSSSSPILPANAGFHHTEINLTRMWWTQERIRTHPIKSTWGMHVGRLKKGVMYCWVDSMLARILQRHRPWQVCLSGFPLSWSAHNINSAEEPQALWSARSSTFQLKIMQLILHTSKSISL